MDHDGTFHEIPGVVPCACTSARFCTSVAGVNVEYGSDRASAGARSGAPHHSPTSSRSANRWSG
jgi:hypothetical protein